MVDRDALIARAWKALLELHGEADPPLHELARRAIAAADAHPEDAESPLSVAGGAAGWERGVAACVRAYAAGGARAARPRKAAA